MTECGCEAPELKTGEERRVPRTALGLNAAMAVIGTLIGLYVIKEAVEILRDARSEANNRIEDPNAGQADE